MSVLEYLDTKKCMLVRSQLDLALFELHLEKIELFVLVLLFYQNIL